MHRHPALCLATACAALTAGCASHAPVTLAITELGSASKMEYGADHLRFIRAVAIHGLGGEEVVGMLTKDPDPKQLDFDLLSRFFRVGSKDLPDSLSPRVSNGCSKILETTFAHAAEAANPATVAALRDGFIKLERSIADELRTELDLMLLDGLASRVAAQADDAGKGQLFDEFTASWPRLEVKDEATMKRATQQLRLALEAQHQRSAAIQAGVDEALRTPGIVVTRWARAKKSSFGLGSAVGSGSVARDREITGYLILGAPRVTTLMVGDDLVHRIRGQRDGIDSYMLPKRLYTGIHQLRAKTVAYAESQSEALAASLQSDLTLAAQKLKAVSAAPGSKLGAALKALEVKVRAEFARVTELGTSGLLQAGELRMHDFRFYPDAAYAESVRAELDRARDYRPVYSARATLDRLSAEGSTQPADDLCTRPVDLALDLLDRQQNPVALSHVEGAAQASIRSLLGADKRVSLSPAEGR